MINSKKGIELTMNVLVVLIISILIFGSALFLLNKIVKGGEDIQNQVDQSTENQLKSLLSQGQIVALPENSKTVSSGKAVIFWIGIKNVLGEKKNFAYTISFDSAYDNNQKKIPLTDTERKEINQLWLFNGKETGSSDGPIELENNKLAFRDIFIKPISRKRGTYFFNVCVYDLAEHNDQFIQTECSPNPSLTLINVDDALYPSNRLFKLIIKIE